MVSSSLLWRLSNTPMRYSLVKFSTDNSPLVRRSILSTSDVTLTSHTSHSTNITVNESVDWAGMESRTQVD